jgi:hypothetical protein
VISQGSFVRPPRIASWLVDLFTPSEQAESIAGDLLEEFSEVASKSGIASARRWYWRQSVESIAHLIGTGFRVAPWTIAGAVVVGFLLRRFGSGLTEHAIEAYFNWYPIFAHHHWHVYVFCVTHGILIGSLIESMLIGCIVAMAAKGREMVATMTLTVLLAALNGVNLVQLARHWPEVHRFLLPILGFILGDSIMIVAGGGIVRKSRSTAGRRPSSA